MGLTHFPNGVASFGVPVMGGATIPSTTGTYFFVDSGNTNASTNSVGTSPDAPLSTIDSAINKCTANNGDIIIVMPGHTESLTTASQISMDVAGVTVIGLGVGHTRPTLVYDTATSGIASVSITASNCRWSNIVHVASVASVDAAIDVSGPASATATQHTEIDHCRFTFDATGVEFVAMVRLGDGATNSADYVYIHDNWFEAENIDGCGSALLIDDCQFVHIIRNLFTGDFNSVCIDGAAGSSACLDYVIAYNLVRNLDNGTANCIDLDDAATGIVMYNGFAGAAALASNVDFGACFTLENYVVDAVDVSGVIIPVTTAA